MTFLLIDSSRVLRQIERELLLSQWPAADIIDTPSLELAAPFLEDHYKPIDLVLIGWHADASATIAHLRHALPQALILLVLPLTAQNALLSAIHAGASNYLYKPFTPDVFIEKIYSTLDLAGRPRHAA